MRSHPSANRAVFKIVKFPVGFGELPEILEQIVGYSFFKTDARGLVFELEPPPKSEAGQDFWVRLNELAHDIAKALREMGQVAPALSADFASA